MISRMSFVVFALLAGMTAGCTSTATQTVSAPPSLTASPSSTSELPTSTIQSTEIPPTPTPLSTEVPSAIPPTEISLTETSIPEPTKELTLMEKLQNASVEEGNGSVLPIRDLDKVVKNPDFQVLVGQYVQKARERGVKHAFPPLPEHSGYRSSSFPEMADLGSVVAVTGIFRLTGEELNGRRGGIVGIMTDLEEQHGFYKFGIYQDLIKYTQNGSSWFAQLIAVVSKNKEGYAPAVLVYGLEGYQITYVEPLIGQCRNSYDCDISLLEENISLFPQAGENFSALIPTAVVDYPAREDRGEAEVGLFDAFLQQDKFAGDAVKLVDDLRNGISFSELYYLHPWLIFYG